jgi:diguanylate cyclase (GGDEF)-like protein
MQISTSTLPFFISKSGRFLEEASSNRSEDRRVAADMEGSNDAFYILKSVRDEAGEIVDFRFDFVNASGARLILHTPEQVLGNLLCELFPFHKEGDLFEQYKHVAETGEPLEQDFPVDDPSIVATWLHHLVVKIEDGIAITATDISAHKENELKLARLISFTQSIVSSSPFATIVTDTKGIITSINPAAERMLWYSNEELVGRETPLILLSPQAVASRAASLSDELCIHVAPGIDVLKAKPERGLIEEAEWEFFRRDGSHFDVQLTVSSLTDAAGEIIGLILIAYDITERKRTEDYISHLAHHDALTKLPTRMLLHDRLAVALSRAGRYGHKVGLLMIDLDNFKRVNDLMGHHMGDELLVSVANCLLNTVRTSDTVARMGGDEFVIVLDDLHTIEEAEVLAAKLIETLRSPIVLGNQTLTPTASIGICLYPDNADSAESMLKNADAAMYQMKSEGRNGYQSFTLDMASAASRKRLLEAGLHHALARNEMELVYQPQISMSTGKVTGVEALLRWNSSRLGTVMPAEFIPLAEESGLIVPIGEWVLRTACRCGKELQLDMGEPLTIAVNISPRQFQHDSLPRVIREAIAECNLDPTTLELEITENILVSESPKAMAILEEVRSLGVRVAIDDFGTGFSSMSYIMRFRVDRLKIDQSFIRNMTTDSDSRAITSAVIALASGLNITVVAEGVETDAHRDLLLSKGCDEAQGYLYSQPVPYDGLPSVLRGVHGAIIAASKCLNSPGHSLALRPAT